MTKLKKYNTLSDWETAKSNLEYPSVGLVGYGSVVYMTPPVHTLPIKAVFYDSATGSFVKMYPDEITEAIPTYTPIGVEVVPAEHDVYGTGQAGIMSLAEMNYSTPDTGSSSHRGIYWGGYGTDTSLPNYGVVNTVNGKYYNGCCLPSDQFTGATSLDGVSKYYDTSSDNAPSPFNANGSRNEAYYTTVYSTANALSDFNGVGNTSVLTELATGQSDWKTASTITNSYNVGYYPAACCCWRFHTAGTDQGQWYLPACGEMGYVINRISAINTTINKVLSVYSSVVAVAVTTDGTYWPSSEVSNNNARFLSTGDGGVRSFYKKNGYFYARAFLRL
jgi:hypothetical protein